MEVDASVASIVPRYLARLRDGIGAVRDALAEGDLEQSQVFGHQMKGSGSGYGFDRITEIGALMEAAASDGDGERVSDALDELERFLAAVDVVYVED